MANKKLIGMLEETKRLKKDKISNELMEELRKERLVLPGVLPRNISPEAMKQFIENQGKNKPLPQGAHPEPIIIQNDQGEKFVPLFTSIEEMSKGKYPIPLSLNTTFDAAAAMVQEKEDLMGVVINPFTHNIVMRLNREKLKKKPEKSGEITIEQYHALARRQMESAYLPSQLFEKKGMLVDKLCEEKGVYLREMYEEVYQEEIACPYTPEDFEILSLNISETVLIAQIAMPEKNRFPHLCHSVIFGFDREKNKIWYYAIIYEGNGQPSTLVQVTETGEAKNLGEAPAEGSELTRVMELMQGEE